MIRIISKLYIINVTRYYNTIVKKIKGKIMKMYKILDRENSDQVLTPMTMNIWDSNNGVVLKKIPSRNLCK